LLLFSVLHASAQEQAGSIQGIVKDSSGGVLPGATVEARSASVVGTTTAVSDAAGAYRFPALPPGTYEITAALQGFKGVKVPSVQLQLGQALKLDIALELGTLSESVQVTSESSPIIDVRQNITGATISNDVIERIPRGRDFTSVVQIVPGANDESRAGGIQFDGASGSENRFIIDGVDTTNLQTGVSGKTVFTDFIETVQVKTSGYSAEYGGSTGGVINAITKSGGNQFRGSLGTYYRNDGMQGDLRKGWRINPFTDCTANTCAGTAEFVATPDTLFENWNPIGDLGGPILQNKAWFYFGTSYNRTDNERTTTFRNSPPPYETRTLTSWSDSKYYNWSGTTQLSNAVRLRVSGALTRGGNRGSIPGSLQPDGSFFADGTSTNGYNTAAWDSDPEKFRDRWERTGGNNRNDLYSANLDWGITDRLFANIQGGYLAYDNTSVPEFAGTALIHSFSTGNLCSGVPGSTSCPHPQIPDNLRQASGYTDNKSTSQTVKNLFDRTYLNANTSWFTSFLGDHQFKFGVRLEQLGNSVDSGARQPTISINWNSSYSALDGRTVRGTYGYYTVSKGVVTVGDVSSTNWSFWAQDSWTIKRNFTLNAGVRTENENVPSYQEQYPGIKFGFADKIAPRLGFAYDIKGDSRWKAFGSYGKYFDITKLEMPRGSFGADHWIQYMWTLDTFDWPSINCQEGPTGCPGTFIEQNDRRHPANQADPALTAYFGREQNTVEPNLKPVETGELTLGLDHELASRMSVGLRYTHKWLVRTIEDVGVLVPGVGEVFFIANPGEGVARQILPEPAPAFPKAEREYDAVELTLTKRLANRWSVFAGYTWSRLFGNYGGLASSDENGRTSPNVERYFDGQYLMFDKDGNPVTGLLPTDRPHYFKTQLTYDTPWGTNVGLFGQVSSGTVKSTSINLLGYSPTFINGRGDLGRTPVFSQIDMYLQHDFRLPGGHRLNVNLNIDNLFDQDTVTSYTTTPWRDSFSVPASIATTATTPGVLSPRDAYLLSGFDPNFLVSAMRSAGARMRDNSLYGLPAGFQGRRQLRLGVKYVF
jgi:hypothetical protein